VGRRPRTPTDLISATEIATWVYCPEQWRLEHGLGLKSGNRRERSAGIAHHTEKAVAERQAGWLLATGRFLISLAIGVFLLLLWWQR
jgi:hypothetical protein